MGDLIQRRPALILSARGTRVVLFALAMVKMKPVRVAWEGGIRHESMKGTTGRTSCYRILDIRMKEHLIDVVILSTTWKSHEQN